MLGAFNEATPDWLSLFMFTFFTDRDGKFQLASLAESGLTRWPAPALHADRGSAPHVRRRNRRRPHRAAHGRGHEAAQERGSPKRHWAAGVIDLPTIQRYLNLYFAVTLDLFGSEVSTNAANAFNAGLKGRFRETQIEDDHRLENVTYPVLQARRRRDQAASTSRR